MLRMSLLLLLTVVFGCASMTDPKTAQEMPDVVAEEPDTGNPVVKIKLRPQGKGKPRRIIVGPRGVGICEQAEEKVCGDTITFRWIGEKEAGEKITITFEESVSTGAKTSSAEECFGKASDTIMDAGKASEVTFKANPGKCIPKSRVGKPAVAFFYTISCNDPEDTKCGGVVPLDPMALVEGGGG